MLTSPPIAVPFESTPSHEDTRPRCLVAAVLLSNAACARPDAAPPLGFRVPVPVGTMSLDLTVSDCVPKKLSLTLPVEMAKDHLARQK